MKLECKLCGTASNPKAANATVAFDSETKLVYCGHCDIYFKPDDTPEEKDTRTNETLKAENQELREENERLLEKLTEALKQNGAQYRGSKIVHRAIERQKQDHKLSQEKSLPL